MFGFTRGTCLGNVDGIKLGILEDNSKLGTPLGSKLGSDEGFDDRFFRRH